MSIELNAGFTLIVDGVVIPGVSVADNFHTTVVTACENSGVTGKIRLWAKLKGENNYNELHSFPTGDFSAYESVKVDSDNTVG